MKVTGYQIREALKRFTQRVDVNAKLFKEAIWKFAEDDATGKDPISAGQAFADADLAVAQLETAQQKYNLMVQVKVLDQTMPLMLAVKLIGGAGRLEKMWRDAVTDTGKDRYSMRDMVRNKDEERARKTISVKDALEKSDKAAQYASALRAAIAVGNSTEVEIDLNPELLK